MFANENNPFYTFSVKRKIVIAPYEAHRILFSLFRKDDVFSDTKFITLDELVEGLTYSYSLEAVKFIIKKLDLPLNVALSYLRILSLLPEREVDGYDFLFSLKRELIEKKLFLKNELFSYELSQADIEVYYYSKNNPFLKKFLKDYSVIYHIDEAQKLNYKVFSSNDEQYIYVYNKIEQLLLKGVKANKIFLYGLTEEDKAVIDRLNYNYDFNLNNAYRKHLIDLLPLKNVIANFDGELEKSIVALDNKDENYDIILSFLKDYFVEGISIELQKEVYLEASRRLTYKSDSFKEAVRVISKPIVDEDEYLFIVNYGQGVIPVLEKDDDVIDDVDKVKLGIPTSEENNVATNEEFVLYLANKGHICLCYPKKNYANKLMVSPLATRLDQKDDFKTNLDEIYSYKEARLEYANLLDIKRKFIYEHPLLNSYASKLVIPYMEYNPFFKGVKHFSDINVIKLSYSSLSSYLNCAYKYYLDYVLKLDDLEPPFNLTLGSLTHKILANIDSDSSFEEIYDRAYEYYQKDFSIRDKIMLRRLKDDLKKTFEFVKEYESHVENGSFLREEPFSVDVSNNIKLVGVIDKIIYSGIDNRFVSILDYKSGSETFKEEDVQFGLSLQLPIYSYIFSQDTRFKDNELIAICIERIFSEDADKFVSDSKYKAGLKIYGEYLKNKDALTSLDTNMLPGENSQYFKYLSNADTANYPARNISHIHEKEFYENLEKISHQFLLDVGYSVLNNNFAINPKIYKGDNIACKYCSYRDICFRNNNNFVVLSSEEEENDGD